MRRIAGTTAAAAMVLGAFCVSVMAQKTTTVHPGKGGSPHVKSEWVVDGANISIEYGRPSLKGRSEESQMPPGKPWRTGADEATVITSNKSLMFGSIVLPAGSYTINTQPGATDWQLILGTLGKPGQWGIPYNATLEKGRTAMRLAKNATPVEMVTISIDDTPAGATLRIEWGTAKATVDFMVH